MGLEETVARNRTALTANKERLKQLEQAAQAKEKKARDLKEKEVGLESAIKVRKDVLGGDWDLSANPPARVVKTLQRVSLRFIAKMKYKKRQQHLTTTLPTLFRIAQAKKTTKTEQIKQQQLKQQQQQQLKQQQQEREKREQQEREEVERQQQMLAKEQARVEEEKVMERERERREREQEQIKIEAEKARLLAEKKAAFADYQELKSNQRGSMKLDDLTAIVQEQDDGLAVLRLAVDDWGSRFRELVEGLKNGTTLTQLTRHGNKKRKFQVVAFSPSKAWPPTDLQIRLIWSHGSVKLKKVTRICTAEFPHSEDKHILALFTEQSGNFPAIAFVVRTHELSTLHQALCFFMPSTLPLKNVNKYDLTKTGCLHAWIVRSV